MTTHAAKMATARACKLLRHCVVSTLLNAKCVLYASTAAATTTTKGATRAATAAETTRTTTTRIIYMA